MSPRVPVQYQHTRELISAQKTSHKHNKDRSRLQQLTWHANKYKVHKLHQRYILKIRHWWYLCTVYLLVCQVRVTVTWVFVVVPERSMWCTNCVYLCSHSLVFMLICDNSASGDIYCQHQAFMVQLTPHSA